MNCATHQLEVSQYGLYSHRCVFSSNIMLDWNIFDPKQGRSYSWAGRVFIGGVACIYTTPNYHRIFNSQVSSSAIFWAPQNSSKGLWLYLLVTSGLAPFWKHTSEDLKLVRCWDEKGRLGISAFYLSEKFYQSEKCGANLGGLLLVDS